MAINLPDNPTIGQVFTAGDVSWQWDGSVWASLYTPDVIDGGTP